MDGPVGVWVADEAEDDRLLASAVALVEFARTSPALHSDHPRRLVSEAIWFWTERGRPSLKYRIRFRTRDAIHLQATLGMTAAAKHLAHEHVHQRKAVVANLLKEEVDVRATLLAAQACVVTREEHARLSQVRGLDGWIRYQEAGVQPIDLATGDPVDLGVLVAADRSAWV